MLSPMGISGNLGLYGGLRACGRGLMGVGKSVALPSLWWTSLTTLPHPKKRPFILELTKGPATTVRL